MALSDYDALAMSLAGEPCSPTFVTSWGLEVELYKNWVYLRHPAMWVEGCGFTAPTFAQVNEGSLRFGTTELWVTRGSDRLGDREVYVAVRETHHSPEPGIASFATGMVACGMYLGADTDRIGESQCEFLRGWLRGLDDGDFTVPDIRAARRHNQGDAFFAGTYGVETPSTAPGETAPRLLDDALRGWTTDAGDG